MDRKASLKLLVRYLRTKSDEKNRIYSNTIPFVSGKERKNNKS